MVLKCSRIVAVDRVKRRKMGQIQKTEIGAILRLAKGLDVFSAR
jgi:hypothetical protein